MFVQIPNSPPAPPGKLLKTDGSDLLTTGKSRCSGHPLHLNVDGSERQPWARRLQSLCPMAPRWPGDPWGHAAAASCERAQLPPHQFPLYITYLPAWDSRGHLGPAPSQLRGKDGQRATGEKIYLLIANEHHLFLLARKQGNLVLLLH